MDKQQIFNELCEHSSREDCVDRRAFIQFLQANGYCFPGHLTEAFFRRFNFEKEDTLTFDQFSLALLQLSAAHQAAGRLAAGSQDPYNQSQNIRRLPTVNAENEEDIFALSKSSWNPGQSSVWNPGQSAVNDVDSLAFSASGLKKSDDILQRADSNNDSLAFSASGASGFFNRSRVSSMMSKTGSKQLRKSSLKQRSSSMKSSGAASASMKRKGRKPGEQIVDFQLTTESFGRSSINHRADTQSFLQDSLVDTKKNSSLVLDDRIINAEQFVDFALTQQTVDISVKVDGQLESLRSFLDLLRMRLSIQEDFTLGGIVSYFDPSKKGYITAADLKNADVHQSLDHLDDEDLHHILTPR